MIHVLRFLATFAMLMFVYVVFGMCGYALVLWTTGGYYAGRLLELNRSTKRTEGRTLRLLSTKEDI